MNFKKVNLKVRCEIIRIGENKLRGCCEGEERNEEFPDLDSEGGNREKGIDNSLYYGFNVCVPSKFIH